jgi:hypothetical protein
MELSFERLPQHGIVMELGHPILGRHPAFTGKDVSGEYP